MNALFANCSYPFPSILVENVLQGLTADLKQMRQIILLLNVIIS